MPGVCSESVPSPMRVFAVPPLCRYQRVGTRAGQRPLLLVTPGVLTHHEDPDRRFLVEPVLRALQVIVVPLQVELP